MAVDAGTSPAPANPAALNATDTGTPGGTPAMMALPANITPLSADASSTRKFYTITAALRETYDDNVNTANTNPQSSFETMLSPSILVDFPKVDSDFSARYTFDLTLYTNRGQNNGGSGNNNNNNGGGSIEYTHEFVAQYTHTFSERFILNAAEQFRNYTEPSLFESTGTAYRSGAYISNIFNGTFNAQWTPLLGTTTTYSNTIIRYDDSQTAATQNSIENTASNNFNFAILPKVSGGFGGIVDDITYETDMRGYTNYTAFAGVQWQILPSMSVVARGGGAYTEPVQAKASLTPYAAFSFDWKLGARSELTFNYSHQVTPSDQVDANGQISDQLSSNFRYDITTSLSAHLQGILTLSDTSQSLTTSGTLSPGTLSSTTETVYALDTGLTYHYNSYLSFESGIILTGVTSNVSELEYTRDQAYVGVRGTY